MYRINKMSKNYHLIRDGEFFSFNDTVYKKNSTQYALTTEDKDAQLVEVLDITGWNGLVTPVTNGGKKRSKRTRKNGKKSKRRSKKARRSRRIRSR